MSPIWWHNMTCNGNFQVLMIDDRSVAVRRTSVNRFSESLPDYEDVKVSLSTSYLRLNNALFHFRTITLTIPAFSFEKTDLQLPLSIVYLRRVKDRTRRYKRNWLQASLSHRMPILTQFLGVKCFRPRLKPIFHHIQSMWRPKTASGSSLMAPDSSSSCFPHSMIVEMAEW